MICNGDHRNLSVTKYLTSYFFSFFAALYASIPVIFYSQNIQKLLANLSGIHIFPNDPWLSAALLVIIIIIIRY